jgi:hypothetical protein
MNTESLQIIHIVFIQNLQVILLISWVIEWSKGGLPQLCTIRNFTNLVWAIWNLSNNKLFWIIPNPGRQNRIILSVESVRSFWVPVWPVLSGLRCVDSTVPTTECHVTSAFWTPCGGTGISITRILGRILGVQQISFQILPIVRFRGLDWWSSRKLVKWVLPDTQITPTIIGPAGRWSRVTHQQLAGFQSLYTRWLSESATCTGSH